MASLHGAIFSLASTATFRASRDAAQNAPREVREPVPVRVMRDSSKATKLGVHSFARALADLIALASMTNRG